MKYMIHCIFRADPNMPRANFNRDGWVLEADGLAAAVTHWPDQQPPVDVARLVAYEKAIARLHAARTVIPLRFGCVVEGESEVFGLLREHRAEYEQLLAQWEGLTEMGLQLWRGSEPEEAAPAAAALTAGARYIAALRGRYPGLTPAERSSAASIAERFEGLVRDRREEAGPAAKGRLVSLYFLVPRAEVSEFRELSRGIDLPSGMQLMVSGPWPPYNFTAPARP